jgi:hypothetical protein
MSCHRLASPSKNTLFLSISRPIVRLTSRSKKDEGRAMRHTFSGNAKSVAGAAFIGLGIIVLYENLDLAASQLKHLFGNPGLPGILPTVTLAALRVLQAYAANHQRFVACLFQHALVTLWPLLLVMAGTALSRDPFPGNADAITKKDRETVDFNVRRSTLK